MRLFRKPLGSITALDNMRAEIASTLESKGWDLIEKEIKKNLDKAYSALISVDKDRLERLQNEIHAGLDLLNMIYKMAGLKFKYSGYERLDRVYDLEEKTDFEKAEEEYLKIIGGLNGTSNG